MMTSGHWLFGSGFAKDEPWTKCWVYKKGLLSFSDPFGMVDFKYSQGVNGSFILHNVSGRLFKALLSFPLFCFSDTIVVNGVLLGFKSRA